MNDTILTIDHPGNPDLEVTGIEENDHDIVVWATHKPGTAIPFCEECGVESPHTHANGYVEWQVWDTPARGKRVKIVLKNRRVRCVEEGEDGKCNRTYTLTPAEVHPEYQMTEACYEHIAQKSLHRRFTRISDDVGPSDTTIGKICREYIQHLDETVLTATPRYLGIDEVKPASTESAYCMLTNVQERTVIEVLRDNKSVTQGVVMDMSRGYKSLAHDNFPGADVIIDKYHILDYVKESFKTVRKAVAREQGTSTEWKRRRFKYLQRHDDLPSLDEMPPDDIPFFREEVGRLPKLQRAWWLYQRMFDIFDMDLTRDEARDAILEWKTKITPELEAPFYEFTGKFDRWGEQILNYFEHGVTNAFTENRNEIAQTLQREGRGYSFEVLRGKVIYGREQLKKPKFGQDIHYRADPYRLTYGAKMESLASGLHE
jgi:transposase